MTMKLVDILGKDAGSIQLPAAMFEAKINETLVAQAVRVYLTNQRVGSASTKSRGEVAGSTRKIYRQKGTGRARHGGIRAPIFVGGGIAFGPKPKDFSLSLSKKMKKLALFSALSAKQQDKRITIVSGTEKMAPKTKEAAKFFKAVSLTGKNTLFVVDGKTDNVKKAAQNLPFVTLLPYANLNTYDVTRAEAVVFMQEAAAMLSEHFMKEEKN